MFENNDEARSHPPDSPGKQIQGGLSAAWVDGLWSQLERDAQNRVDGGV